MNLNQNDLKALLTRESGVYDLAFDSSLPSARRFRRWVVTEVLPSIRERGSFQLNQQRLELERSLEQLSLQSQQQVEAHERQLEEQRAAAEARRQQELEAQRLAAEARQQELEAQRLAAEVALAEERRRNANMRTYISNVTALQKNEYIYVATTPSQARQKLFKIGTTINLRQRLNGYHTGQPADDREYYAKVSKCANGKALERWMLGFLCRWRDPQNTELVRLGFRYLSQLFDFMVNHHDTTTDHVNQFISTTYQEAFADPDVEDEIPPPVSVTDMEILVSQRVGNETVITNLSHYTEEQQLEIILNYINRYQEVPVTLPAFTAFLKRNAIHGNSNRIWRLMKKAVKDTAIVIKYR